MILFMIFIQKDLPDFLKYVLQYNLKGNFADVFLSEDFLYYSINDIAGFHG